MKSISCILFLIGLSLISQAQFAPQAGKAGTTAIPSSSSIFQCWANNCALLRGYMDIDSTSIGCTSYGEYGHALNPPDGAVVSLGDSGVATLSFPGNIYNGPGYDFAVFENGFINASNDSQSFMELAFVEVSSDGVRFFRFPAQSAIQNTAQVPGFGVYLYANQVHNLAGKYIGGFGTPFDLEDLQSEPGLDIYNITHVRIIDVIGDIRKHKCYDSAGRIINDPYPTKFSTGGFDLDAVGVIHRRGNVFASNVAQQKKALAFPNPIGNELNITYAADQPFESCTITNPLGAVLTTFQPDHFPYTINTQQWPAGIYWIQYTQGQNKWVEAIVKHSF